jgi:hypothetical protein
MFKQFLDYGGFSNNVQTLNILILEEISELLGRCELISRICGIPLNTLRNDSNYSVLISW